MEKDLFKSLLWPNELFAKYMINEKQGIGLENARLVKNGIKENEPMNV